MVNGRFRAKNVLRREFGRLSRASFPGCRSLYRCEVSARGVVSARGGVVNVRAVRRRTGSNTKSRRKIPKTTDGVSSLRTSAGPCPSLTCCLPARYHRGRLVRYWCCALGARRSRTATLGTYPRSPFPTRVGRPARVWAWQAGGVAGEGGVASGAGMRARFSRCVRRVTVRILREYQIV